MSNTLSKRLFETRKNTLKPSPTISLVEWADTYRFLSPESSSQPGRFNTSTIEAAREPMMAVTDPSVKKISIMACTQLFKTELINNIVGYFIHQDPSPIIVMQPTVNLAKTWSKDRLTPMIRDTPVLNELVKTKKSRDSGNTLQHKSFPGGHITVIGSNSPSELASRPVRITLRDEIDKYEENIEGDPSSLIQERAATFWNALDVGVCSPTIKGRSKIELEYLASDQRKFHVDCPHCGFNQFMKWENVKWQNNDPMTASYVCPECTVCWTEKDRLTAIKSGKYVAYAPFNGHAGFHVNKLASPWQPLSELVKKWLIQSKEPSTLKTFINTQLAETWEEKGEAPEHMRLFERRELYDINSCPEGVEFLTAGVDVQKDRFEVEIVGWGRGKQSWSIDYRVYMGETSQENSYKVLDELLNETWELFDSRQIQIRVLAIDSGYNTQHVYNWARKHVTSRVMVIKGQDNSQTILGQPTATEVSHAGHKIKRGIKVWPIGSSLLKQELYGFLRLPGAGDDGIYPNGYCHFPQYNEYFFKMLTAEHLMMRSVNGKTKYVWEKKFERNEALDCRNMARAAAALIGIDRFKDEHWNNMRGQTIEIKEETKKTTTPTVYVDASKKPSNSFWNHQKRKNFW
jgi:phage terminase large subunit GpA-like protein